MVVIVGRSRRALLTSREGKKVTQHAPSANEVLARAAKSLMMCDFCEMRLSLTSLFSGKTKENAFECFSLVKPLLFFCVDDMCASETMTRDLSLPLSLSYSRSPKATRSAKDEREDTKARRIMASVLTSADEIEPKRSFFFVHMFRVLFILKVSFFTNTNSRALSLNDLFA